MRAIRNTDQAKPENRKKVLLRLWSYLFHHKWLILAAFFLTFLSNFLALIGPMLSGFAIDAIGTQPGRPILQKSFIFAA